MVADRETLNVPHPIYSVNQAQGSESKIILVQNLGLGFRLELH